MYVKHTVEFDGSPDALWAFLVEADGAALRTLGARMAQGGPLGKLLAFGWPSGEIACPITFACKVEARTDHGGALSVRWEGRHATLEGELEVVPAGAGRGRLRLTAAYEPPWSAALCDQATLRVIAGAAARTFLEAVAGASRPSTATLVAVADHPPMPVPRRILIEDEDPAWYRLMVQLAEPGEYEFQSCPGPVLAPDGCPVLEGGSCPKVEWADSILNSLDLREEANRAVLAILKKDRREMPLPPCPGSPATHWLDRRS